MSHRYRLMPTAEQELTLREHCAHARYVWNLAWSLHQFGQLETYGEASRRIDRNGNEYIHQKRRPVRRPPGYLEQCRMLTEARAAYDWLRAGSQKVQQQALRDFDKSLQEFFNGTSKFPGRRKRNRHEGFRVVGQRGTGNHSGWDVRRLSRHVGEVRVPKVGWVKFRWSRPVPAEAKSYRVSFDRAGRWHVAFVALPAPIPAPGAGEVVGIDRGVAVSAALSTGELLIAPKLTAARKKRLRLLQRKVRRRKPGSNRRASARLSAARLRTRGADARKDWCEKVSTDVARRFDVIRLEDLNVRGMKRSARGSVEKPGRNVRQKAALNREIEAAGWRQLGLRLEGKAPGRVEKVNPRFTSQRCSACGHIAAESRKSQALFACVACNFTLNADVNAARNIAAGHAVTVRGGDGAARPVNREPQMA